MSLIRNLVKEPSKDKKESTKKKNEQASAEEEDVEESEEKKPRPIVRSATDLQRLKLEKLMKNPDKPIQLPEQRKDKDYMQSVPTFVRNVMGSSAGAGSGEFHVYRHLRRKEYARQKMIQAKSVREQLDEDYQKKLENNRRAAEEKTAKKRAKRLKKKERAKRARKHPQKNPSQSQSNTDDGGGTTDSSEDENSAAEDGKAGETVNKRPAQMNEEESRESANQADNCQSPVPTTENEIETETVEQPPISTAVEEQSAKSNEQSEQSTESTSKGSED